MSRSLLVVIGVLLFLAFHQDVWFWNDDKTLFFGFMPVGLAYHVVFTIAVAWFWFGVVTFAWPTDLEGDDESADSTEK